MDDENPKVVESERWESMTINELIDQRSLMTDRYEFLLDNNHECAPQVKKGLDRINALIDKTFSQ